MEMLPLPSIQYIEAIIIFYVLNIPISDEDQLKEQLYALTWIPA